MKRILAVIMAAALGLSACSQSQTQLPAAGTKGGTETMKESTAAPAVQSTPRPEEQKNYQKASVDFSQVTGMPLFKKFAMFDSGLVPMQRYDRDIGLFDRVAPQSLRIDLFMGQSGLAFGGLVTGTADNPKYDFTELDRLAVMLHGHGVLPYWSWCYIPMPLQTYGSFRTGPTNFKKYGDILEALSKHFKDKGIRLGYQEVYNEPDCNDVFFTGTWQDYIRMYEAGSLALKIGDPDAVIGGPATAFVLPDDELKKNYAEFLTDVKEKNLPLDFFSFHSYGYEDDVFIHRLSIVRDMLSADPRFATTELHMNELNTVVAPWDYTSEGGKLLGNRTMLPYIFNTMSKLIDYPDLTLVNWAQLLDSGVDALGIVDADGHIRPAYFAFEIYARMPVDRAEVENNSQAKMMASASRDRASIVLWNDRETNADVEMNLKNLPFAHGELKIYKLDKNYFTPDGEIKYPVLNASAAQEIDSGNPANLQLTLEKEDVIYIEINNDAPAAPESKPDVKVIRTYHYYPDRSKNSYAEFNENDMTAYLGMGDNEKAEAICGVTLERLPEALTFAFDAGREPKAINKESALGVRVDYEADGNYTKSVYYSDSRFAVTDLAKAPWGTMKKPDDVIIVKDLNGLKVNVAEHAPKGWSGRIIVTFIMKDCGKDSSVHFGIIS